MCDSLDGVVSFAPPCKAVLAAQEPEGTAAVAVVVEESKVIATAAVAQGLTVRVTQVVIGSGVYAPERISHTAEKNSSVLTSQTCGCQQLSVPHFFF